MKIRYQVLFFLSFFPSISIGADPIPAEVLFANPHLSRVDINPSGNVASFYVTEGNTKHLNLYHLDKKIPATAVSFDGSNDLDSYRWIDDNNIYILYGNSFSKNSAIININFGRENNEAVLTRLDKNGFLLGALDATDNKFIYSKIEKQEFELYALTLEQIKNGEFPKQSRFKYPLKNSVLYVFDSNSRTIYGFVVNKKEEGFSIWRFDKSANRWHSFYSWSDAGVDVMPIGAIDNKIAWVLTNELTDKIAVAKFDTETQTVTEIIFEHPEYDLEDAEIDPDTGKLIWVSFYDHGKLARKYFDDESKLALAPLVDYFPGKQISTVASSSDNTSGIVIVFSSDDPGSYYLYDTKTQEIKIVGSLYPELEDYTTSRSEVYTVSSDDGVEIEAYLTRPAGFDNNTLIVMPHGGPIGVRDFDAFDPTVQYLASRGYSIVRGNFRGSQGYGKAFLESGVGEFGQAIEKDISAIVLEVQGKYNFPNICTLGFSYGGYSAMMLAIENPVLYDCVVSMYGVYDLPLLFNENNYKVGDDYRQLIEKTVGEYKSSLLDVSPVYLADKINVPVLLVAGRNDQTAVIEQSNRMKYQLLKHGKNVETLFYYQVGHGHDNWKWDQHQIAYIDDFIRKNLSLSSYQSENANKILAEENGKIADAFSSTDIVDNNPRRAFQHYLAAAKLGQTRSMFNVGLYFITGIGTEKNLDEGVSWMKRASDNDFAAASYKLGTLYIDSQENGSIFNEEESFRYFELAEKQEYDGRATLFLARAYCLGAGVKKDISKCIEKFSKVDEDLQSDKYSNYLKDPINETYQKVLSNILLDERFSNVDLSKFEKIVSNKYDAELYIPDFEVEKIGVYGRNGRNRNQVIVSKSTEIPLQKYNYFGVSFKIGDPEGKNRRTALVAEWLIKRPGTTVRESHKQSLLLGNETSNWSEALAMTGDELIGSEWTINIYTASKVLLYSETFTIVPLDI